MKIKSMRFLFITVIMCFTFSSLMAQNSSLPKNVKAGKCYERCFYYDKPIKWEEVDCKNANINGINVFTPKKTDKERAKFISYQKKLIDFGYVLKANGVLDEKTIKAHHKYLKFKKKQERKAKRRNRKAL